MAGESPDRSKQRESSAEPTSGSAGPVPEARGEAREVRDPRLALAGESGAPSGRGGVDTATKVLSVRTQERDAEDPEGVSGSEDAEDPEGVSGSEDAEDPEGVSGSEDAEDPEGV
ncbi:D-alanyl-D-alanine carboxypeptidase, partial [Streptomyces sp. NPDC005202]